MKPLGSVQKRILSAVGILSLLCLGLLILRWIVTGTARYLFIPENLILSWLGFVFAWILVSQLKVRSWATWQNVGLTFLWLGFLPNSWYVLTDFIHLDSSGQISQLYDIVLISTLVVTGFTLGFYSLYLVHKEFLKRLSDRGAATVVGLVILLSSFAIYLGRDLRWSTWDVVTDPTGVILNVSDRVVDPLGHPSSLTVTSLFFVQLSVMYFALWQVIKPAKKS